MDPSDASEHVRNELQKRLFDHIERTVQGFYNAIGAPKDAAGRVAVDPQITLGALGTMAANILVYAPPGSGFLQQYLDGLKAAVEANAKLPGDEKPEEEVKHGSVH